MLELDAKKILVIRLSSLGDVVLTTAIFPSLKARWPLARITVATKAAFAPLFAGNPNVHEVVTFDGDDFPFSTLASRIKSETWDVVIDLHANLRSWYLRLVAGGNWTVVVNKATVARYALLFTKRPMAPLKRSVRERILDCLSDMGVPVVSKDTQLFPSLSPDFFEKHRIPQGRPLIGVAPGARHATKRWSAEKFAEVANRLAEAKSGTVILLGDRSDAAAADDVVRHLKAPHVNLTGKTNLPALIGITSRLSLLITNDSGLLHIGEALKIPLVAVFGPTVRGFGFAPYRDSSRLVEVNLECRPCTLHGDERCPLGHHRCMTEVGADAVVSAAGEIHAREGAV